MCHKTENMRNISRVVHPTILLEELKKTMENIMKNDSSSAQIRARTP